MHFFYGYDWNMSTRFLFLWISRNDKMYCTVKIMKLLLNLVPLSLCDKSHKTKRTPKHLVISSLKIIWASHLVSPYEVKLIMGQLAENTDC